MSNAVRVKITRVQADAVRQDNLAIKQLVEANNPKIQLLQAQAELLSAQIQALQAESNARLVAHKHFIKMLIAEAGYNMDEFEKYNLEADESADYLVLHRK